MKRYNRKVWKYGRKVVIATEDGSIQKGLKAWTLGAVGEITGIWGDHWLVKVGVWELLFHPDELIDVSFCDECGTRIDFLEMGIWVHEQEEYQTHVAIPTFPEIEVSV